MSDKELLKQWKCSDCKMYVFATNDVKKLKAQLKDANEVIDFYADVESWHGTTICNTDRNRIKSENYTRRGGKRAREYKEKYEKRDKRYKKPIEEI